MSAPPGVGSVQAKLHGVMLASPAADKAPPLADEASPHRRRCERTLFQGMIDVAMSSENGSSSEPRGAANATGFVPKLVPFEPKVLSLGPVLVCPQARKPRRAAWSVVEAIAPGWWEFCTAMRQTPCCAATSIPTMSAVTGLLLLM